MKESELRKIHRYIGVILALFLLLQGGSGMLIALGELFGPHYAHSDTTDGHHEEVNLSDSHALHSEDLDKNKKHGIIGQIHHSNGTVWHFYRVLVGIGVVVMVFSGVILFIKIQHRSKNT
jgi:hypothetical protein